MQSLFFIHSYFQWGTWSFCLVSLWKTSQAYLLSSITLVWTLDELIHNLKIHLMLALIDWSLIRSFTDFCTACINMALDGCMTVIKFASSVWIVHSSYQQSGKIIHLYLLHREDISAVSVHVCFSERSDSKAWCVRKCSTLPVDKVRRAVYLTFPLCSIYNICCQTIDKWREQSGASTSHS